MIFKLCFSVRIDLFYPFDFLYCFFSVNQSFGFFVHNSPYPISPFFFPVFLIQLLNHSFIHIKLWWFDYNLGQIQVESFRYIHQGIRLRSDNRKGRIFEGGENQFVSTKECILYSKIVAKSYYRKQEYSRKMQYVYVNHVTYFTLIGHISEGRL